MPTLSAAQLASVQATHTTDHAETVAVYRAPAVSNGKRGDVTLHTASVACSRAWPIEGIGSRGGRILHALAGPALERSTCVRFLDRDADVLAGDELRQGSIKQKVEQATVWRSVLVVLLSEVRP